MTAGPGAPPVTIIQGPVSFDIDTVLAEHNADRALHSAPPLVWNSTIAAEASAYASTCPGNGLYPPNLPLGSLFYGVNTELGAADFTAAIGVWYGEGESYNYSSPAGYGSNPAYNSFNFAQVRLPPCQLAASMGQGDEGVW